MMLSACDQPRAGLLPNDFGSMPPSAPSILSAVCVCVCDTVFMVKAAANSRRNWFAYLKPKIMKWNQKLPHSSVVHARLKFSKEKTELIENYKLHWNWSHFEILIEARTFLMFEINIVRWLTKSNAVCVCVRAIKTGSYVHSQMFRYHIAWNACEILRNSTFQYTFQTYRLRLAAAFFFVFVAGLVRWMLCIAYTNITQAPWIMPNVLYACIENVCMQTAKALHKQIAKKLKSNRSK